MSSVEVDATSVLTQALNALVDQVPFWERSVAEQAIPEIVKQLPAELAKLGYKIEKVQS